MGEALAQEEQAQGTDVKAFELGLTLAGAISAGAYTAGVLDFLFQALDEWEKHRELPGTPSHRVVIKVITGASAGAITGALSAVALARGLHPVALTEDERARCYPSYRRQAQPFRCVLPSLWRTWVDLPDMLRSGSDAGLLGLRDFEPPNATVQSLLDTTVLDRIKRDAIGAPQEEDRRAVKLPVAYVSAKLHVYMTLSNMRGIPYKVGFGRPDNVYGMITHGDRVHYVVEGLGSGSSATPRWLAEDAEQAALRLSVTTLPTVPGAPLGAWDGYGSAALASGAFPVGLAARSLEYASRNYTQRKLPIDLAEDVFIRPNFPAGLQDPETVFTFQTVDGGMVNNNPFDYAQFALFGRPATASDRIDGRRAILMVAPFPDPPRFLPEGTPGPALTAIMRALFPALVNQARFRISELAPALDERDYSRFLISPKRRIPRVERPAVGAPPAQDERFAIACGLLGGFGGFLGEAFRAHDFQLGRRNCQQFLAESFTVLPGRTVDGAPGRSGEVPVIPLLGTARETVPLPRWPQIGPEALEELETGINRRLDAVVRALIDGQTRSRRLRLALRQGWSFFLRGPVREYVHATVRADLVRRGQLRGYDVPKAVADRVRGLAPAPGHERDDVAAVAAELINPAFRYRTEEGIAKALALPPAFVRAALEALADDRDVPETVRSWHGSWRGEACWTSWARRPAWPARRPIVQWFVQRWNAPKIG